MKVSQTKLLCVKDGLIETIDILTVTLTVVVRGRTEVKKVA